MPNLLGMAFPRQPAVIDSFVGRHYRRRARQTKAINQIQVNRGLLYTWIIGWQYLHHLTSSCLTFLFHGFPASALISFVLAS
ncbi:hypothetical protein BDA96_08G094300 [Sorghum bicolor]|uniref:Uncharacterized protein n=2 Tax=Sorghum bicolor TaxID=4558 RepID=A0A921QFA5_SORBI|nr:hypothetical protein BDA96_08G094300 [Sorghum bicolor]OQU79003.1 hypothetical protein SORBI_3008G087866 [Sorghum bicolor]